MRGREKGLISQTLELFKSHHWGKFLRDGWSAYGLSRTRKYFTFVKTELILNCVLIAAATFPAGDNKIVFDCIVKTQAKVLSDYMSLSI